MWTFILIFSSGVAAQVASQQIKAECEEYEGHAFPSVSADAAPSALLDLKVKQVMLGGRNMLNISWKINIDSSIRLLNCTRISIAGESEYRCKYNPPLGRVQRFESTQKWFHHLVSATHGQCDVQAANLPLPPLGSGASSMVATIVISRPKVSTESVKISQIQSEQPTAGKTFLHNKAESSPEPTPAGLKTKDVVVAVFGSLAALVVLSSCYLIFRNYRSNVAASLGFQNLPDEVPVRVLVVYPAENPAFQRAVVALAEFLQWHGGCSVALDMWTQGKVAELGPMRWLAEQAKTADRVLIVCPAGETDVHCPPVHGFPEASVPAAARDLYPLVLNMVASSARSAGELNRFWAVQLGERRDRKPSPLAPELRTCRTFCLMKDLKKLCQGLHAARRSDRKVSDLLLRPGFSYNQKSAEKLKEAVEMLRGNQTNSSKETEPLTSGISSV